MRKKTRPWFGQPQLSAAAKLVLSAFDKYGELLWPQEALKHNLSKRAIGEGLAELANRHYLLPKSRPYKLNKIGRRAAANHKEETDD